MNAPVVATLVMAMLVSPTPPGVGRQGDAPSPHVITMTAKKYEFSPSTVTVARGERVRIEATALDKTHGIEIKQFNVKVKLEKGKKTVIEFTCAAWSVRTNSSGSNSEPTPGMYGEVWKSRCTWRVASIGILFLSLNAFC